jgi:hypothetical protein
LHRGKASGPGRTCGRESPRSGISRASSGCLSLHIKPAAGAADKGNRRALLYKKSSRRDPGRGAPTPPGPFSRVRVPVRHAGSNGGGGPSRPPRYHGPARRTERRRRRERHEHLHPPPAVGHPTRPSGGRWKGTSLTPSAMGWPARDAPRVDRAYPNPAVA